MVCARDDGWFAFGMADVVTAHRLNGRFSMQERSA